MKQFKNRASDRIGFHAGDPKSWLLQTCLQLVTRAVIFLAGVGFASFKLGLNLTD
jgi:hypothetical protein